MEKICKRFLSLSEPSANSIRYKEVQKFDNFEISLEEFQMKDYFHQLDLENSRVMFWARSKTMRGCSTHYPSDPENIRSLFECKEGCKSIDSIFHWEFSNCYSHLTRPEVSEVDPQKWPIRKDISDWQKDWQTYNKYRIFSK